MRVCARVCARVALSPLPRTSSYNVDRASLTRQIICISPFAEGLAGLSSSMYGLAIKRYTSLKNRNFAYAMLYAIYNLGGALAGFVIDFVSGSTVRRSFPSPAHFVYKSEQLLWRSGISSGRRSPVCGWPFL